MMRGGASLHWKHLEVTVSVDIFSTKSHVFNCRHLTSVLFSPGWHELEFIQSLTPVRTTPQRPAFF